MANNVRISFSFFPLIFLQYAGNDGICPPMHCGFDPCVIISWYGDSPFIETMTSFWIGGECAMNGRSFVKIWQMQAVLSFVFQIFYLDLCTENIILHENQWNSCVYRVSSSQTFSH